MTFGPFRMLRAQHLLLEGEAEVAIGGRAFDILAALLERAGQVVGKDALMAAAWPNMAVEEGNLRLQIAGLRRALRDGVDGNRYIATIAGRGYSFVAPVGFGDPSIPAPAPFTPMHARPPEPLPPAPSRIVGRAEIVPALCEQVRRRRFVTVVGPGGIGKTTVALEIVRRLSPLYRDGVAFVDLSRVSDPGLVAAALADPLGLSVASDNPVPKLLAFLRRQEQLLVLDSCEHVIEAIAAIAEEVAAEAPSVHILATSREPLRATGESVHRLEALERPPPEATLTAAEALTFSSVQLFVERATEAADAFRLTDATAAAAAEICRRLDGIPLAIELAAGRVSAFGVTELAAQLNDSFALLTSGRRTALPRHRTLVATLDWSFRLLSDVEQTLLRRLAIFVGEFTLAAATALTAALRPVQVVSLVADFVQKSLVAVNVEAEAARYRLLDTTRLYCLEKLKEAGEDDAAFRALAIYLATALEPAESDAETRSRAEWLRLYGGFGDDVRAALEWSFSDAGDATVGVALTIAAVPLWVQTSRLNECRGWTELALAALGRRSPDDVRSRMRLSAAFGWSLMYAVGRANDGRAAWQATLADAESLGDTSHRLRAVWGLWINHLNHGEFGEALACARRFGALAAGSSDGIDLMMADRILGTSLHFSGDQIRAGEHIGRMLDRYATLARRPRIARYQFDERVTAYYFQARILWLRGFPDQAMRMVEENVAEAQRLGHALSFASVLGQGACPVALFRGDLDAAEDYADRLLDHARRFDLRLWSTWARGLQGALLARRGDTEAALAVIRQAFEEAGDGRFLPRYRLLTGEYALCLARSGQDADARAVCDATLDQCEHNEEGWYVPELLRIKAAIETPADPARAETHLDRAIAIAERQGARSWTLRAATQRARHGRDGPGATAARAVLADVVGSFSEGFGTDDLRAAKALLETAP